MALVDELVFGDVSTDGQLLLSLLKTIIYAHVIVIVVVSVCVVSYN